MINQNTYNLLTRIISGVLWGLVGVSVIMLIIFYFGGVVPGTEGPNPEPKVTNVILKWSYWLTIFAAFVAVAFPLIYSILNPKNLINLLIVIGIAVVLFFISRALASDEVLKLTGYTGKDNVPSTLKMVGTGLIFMYILLGLAFLGIVFSEIAKFFK